MSTTVQYKGRTIVVRQPPDISFLHTKTVLRQQWLKASSVAVKRGFQLTFNSQVVDQLTPRDLRFEKMEESERVLELQTFGEHEPLPAGYIEGADISSKMIVSVSPGGSLHVKISSAKMQQPVLTCPDAVISEELQSLREFLSRKLDIKHDELSADVQELLLQSTDSINKDITSLLSCMVNIFCRTAIQHASLSTLKSTFVQEAFAEAAGQRFLEIVTELRVTHKCSWNRICALEDYLDVKPGYAGRRIYMKG